MEGRRIVQDVGQSYEEMKLDVPTLDELVKALFDGLNKNFAQVEVNIVDCPDLTLPPYNLAAKGLCGYETAIQVGDVSNVLPNTQKHKLYDIRDVSTKVDVNPAFCIGAGGNNMYSHDRIAGLFMNVFVSENKVKCLSKEVFTKDKTINGMTVEACEMNDPIFSCLANLFVSNGESGPVIRIACKRRTSENSLPESIIKAVNRKFQQILAFGMVLQMVRGKAVHHIASDFAENVKNTLESEKWLLFSEVKAPIIAVGTILTSNPPGCNIAPFHFHSHNYNQAGGHFRYDVTPDEVEYVAYLKPANKFVLIDRSVDQLIITDFRVE